MASHAQNKRGSRGFALLLTLVLVMIAGVVLASVVRIGAAKAVHTHDALESLQRRWATTTMRHTLLSQAETVLQGAERGQWDDDDAFVYADPKEQPINEVRVRLKLDGADYELVFSDEQTKLNPQAMLDWAKPRDVAQVVQALISSLDDDEASRMVFDAQQLEALYEQMQDKADADRSVGSGATNAAADSSSQPRSGFGRWLDPALPRQLVGEQLGGGLASVMTFWGDGRLNAKRTNTRVIVEASKPLLSAGDAASLENIHRRDASQDLSAWLGELDRLDSVEQSLVAGLLTSQSQTYGLWVVAHGKTRSWYSFSVSFADAKTTLLGPGDSEQTILRQRQDYDW